ncbi:MAG: hypothetical protein IKJ16_03025 [Agathobacter sp.]|nr:hypothetical protein [Agathobacter sp.]
MKRTYVSPVIVCENVQPASYISACSWDVKNSMEPESCGAVGDTEYGLEPIKLFTAEINCDCNPGDIDGNNGNSFCYTSSVDLFTYFHS